MAQCEAGVRFDGTFGGPPGLLEVATINADDGQSVVRERVRLVTFPADLLEWRPPRGGNVDASALTAQARQILDRMDDAFYAIDRDWRFLVVNPRAEAFWGRSRDELLGRTMLELFPRFEGSPSYQAHAQALATQAPVEFETISTATGAPVALRIFPDASGLEVYFRDLTERRRLQNELETRGEMLDLAETSAGIGIWVQDLTTATMRATPQFFRLLGVEPRSGPLPQDFARAFRHPDDRERVTLGFREALARGEDSYETEYRIVRPSGEVRWIFGRGRVTRTADGTPWRYSGVDIDITERKRQEEHLRLVLSELQHRTNNLLAIIQGLAQQSARSSQSLGEFLPNFMSRLQGLADSNLLLAQGQWRGAPLLDLLRRQVSPFADLSRFELEGPPVMLSSKAVQTLGMAFHELCTNAMKYGALSVPAGRVRASWRKQADALEIRWEELGGPTVTPPTRKGFGRVVAEQVVGTSLGASVRTEFLPGGVVWTMLLPQAEFSIDSGEGGQ